MDVLTLLADVKHFRVPKVENLKSSIEIGGETATVHTYEKRR